MRGAFSFRSRFKSSGLIWTCVFATSACQVVVLAAVVLAAEAAVAVAESALPPGQITSSDKGTGGALVERALRHVALPGSACRMAVANKKRIFCDCHHTWNADLGS